MCKTDYKFIEKANLPQNDIKHCVISEDVKDTAQFLNKLGIETLFVEYTNCMVSCT